MSILRDTVKAPSEAVGVYFIGDGSFYFEEFFEGDKGYRCGEFFCVPFNLNKLLQSVRAFQVENIDMRNAWMRSRMSVCSDEEYTYMEGLIREKTRVHDREHAYIMR